MPNLDLIVETDLGRDPDDFFALCYLVAAGVNLRALTISPGDPDQIALAKFFLNWVGLQDVPVGSANLARNKSSVGGVHLELLRIHDWPHPTMQADGLGPDVLHDTFTRYPDAQLLCLGPLQSVGPYLQRDVPPISRAVMQGGFCGYHLYEPKVRIERFEGLETCPTFNLNGDVKAGQTFVSTPKIKERLFVGKNVCHTILYDQSTLSLARLCTMIAPPSGIIVGRSGNGRQPVEAEF